MFRIRFQPAITWCLLLAALIVACAPAVQATPQPTDEPTESAGPAEGGIIVLGDISDDPSNVIEEMQPLADYLAAQLDDQGITEGQVKVVATPEEMAEALESGEIDLYFDSVYPATLISDMSGAEPILRRWRDGVEEYHTVIFTTADSGIESVDDLQGHMIAFDEPTSTSGFVLPLVYLIEQDLNPVQKSAPDDEVSSDEVGYVFSGDDDNSLEWLASGQVSAAATDNINFSEDIPEDVRANLVILAETEPLPRQVAVARPGMDSDLLAAIVAALAAAHESPEGQAALEAFDDTARFDEFPEGIDQALERMRELLEIVQQNEAAP